MNELFINKKKWNTFSQEELDQFKQKVFEYYRGIGFPYYSTDNEYRKKELNKLLKYDISKIYNEYLDTGIVSQTMHGLAFCWSFMPHSFAVECNNMRSPLNTFLDDNLFKQVIHKRVKFGDNISDSGIRKMMKLFTGTQGVSNFRPTSAAVIYRKYLTEGANKTWDMCGGYGGRLLGAYKSNVDYVATEPCKKTYDGLCQMKEYLKYDKCEIIQQCAEDYLPKRESLDLCFTSPPYYDTEKYSDEETQSYKRWDSRTKFINGFIYPMFENCFIGLKPQKYMLINIANVKSFPTLEDEVIKTAESVGFQYIEKEVYTLSSVSILTKFKYEPIFVFKKV